MYNTYYRIEMKDQYLVQTHSQIKAARIIFQKYMEHEMQ